MPIVCRFAEESAAMNYARSEAVKGHLVSVEPACCVGGDTVVTVQRVSEATAAGELAEWLREQDDGFNQDGELCREAADQLDALGRIHALLDGQEWGSGTADAIAEELRGLGMVVRAPSDCDCDSRSWHGAEHDSACPLAGLPMF